MVKMSKSQARLRLQEAHDKIGKVAVASMTLGLTTKQVNDLVAVMRKLDSISQQMRR